MSASEIIGGLAFVLWLVGLLATFSQTYRPVGGMLLVFGTLASAVSLHMERSLDLTGLAIHFLFLSVFLWLTYKFSDATSRGPL